MVHNFFDKKTLGGAIKSKIKQNEELTKELHKPLLENLRNEKCTDLLKTMFVVLISQICSW